MFFLYWHKYHVLLCLHVIKEGKATHPICQDLYGPHPIPLQSFLSYMPPVSIKSCFPSFFVKFVSLRWAGPIPKCSSTPLYFAFISSRELGKLGSKKVLFIRSINKIKLDLGSMTNVIYTRLHNIVSDSANYNQNEVSLSEPFNFEGYIKAQEGDKK